MAQYSKENVLVGAAGIFVSVAEYDEDSEVDIPTPTAGTVGPPLVRSRGTADNLVEDEEGVKNADWRSVGYTTGGVEVTYTPDFGEVEVDQLLDAAVMFKQRMTVSVSTTLAEATLENLVFAWGQADDSITDATAPVRRTLSIQSGDLGDRPIERSVAFVGQAPGGTPGYDERVYFLKRCLNVEASSFSLSRADATTIPVSLRCLPDNAGEYGTITDSVTPTA